MNFLGLARRSVLRKPVKSILLLIGYQHFAFSGYVQQERKY